MYAQRRLEELQRIECIAMRELEESKLENVCESAYALNLDFTPNYKAMAIETPGLAGHELRVVGTGITVTPLGYGASDEAVRRATRSATRMLMTKLREQAQRWLDANPEKEP